MRFRTCTGLFALLLAGALIWPANEAAAAGLGGSRAGSFKVVKPPPKGARKRITIHQNASRSPSVARRQEKHAWFWNVAARDIGAARAGREAALSRTAGERLASPATARRVDEIRANFGQAIDEAARAANISPALLAAVIAAESGGDPKAVSRAGAQGLAQLMPATAARFDVEDPFNPAQNLRGSATYLDILLKMFSDDALLALAGYNAGENAVIKHDGVPPFVETRDYVPIVLGYFDVASAACASEPKTARASCDMKKAP